MPFREKFGSIFKPKAGTRKLSKADPAKDQVPAPSKRSFASSRSGAYEDEKYAGDNVDIQTGERQDVTALLHGLAHRESMSSLDSRFKRRWEAIDEERPPGEAAVASLPEDVWRLIASYLSPAEVAALTLSSRTLFLRLGWNSLVRLDSNENHAYKIQTLLCVDEAFPEHLLCFTCGVYHKRLHPGEERLRPTQVVNPVIYCPKAAQMGVKPSRIRIAVGHTLPFNFARLVMRAHLYSPQHGIPLDSLFRRWQDRDSEWKYESSYFIYKGHLLMRVVSRCFAAANLPPSAQRTLLYSPREDYTPYFSTCSHWRDGVLMKVCKCALGHIPEPPVSIAQQLRNGPMVHRMAATPSPIVTLCSFCRPMRRCPECPTEYLVDIKFGEDKNEPMNKFKQIIVVTRWSDLGNCVDSSIGEWAAINGRIEYNSFKEVGKRSVAGKFESQSGVAIPGQRMMSLNPKGDKYSEDDDDWY